MGMYGLTSFFAWKGYKMSHHTGTNPSVFIRMMDLFTIEADGVNHEELMAKSRKGVSLIQYLVLERGRPVSSQRLIRELWSDRRSESPENALKTMVSRTRTALNAISPDLGSCIVSGQGVCPMSGLTCWRLSTCSICFATSRRLPATGRPPNS